MRSNRAIAWADAHDVLGADALVLVQGPPGSPGKHTELGIAIGAGIPVYPVLDPWLDNDERETEPGVFAALVPDPVPLATLIGNRFTDLASRTRDAQALREKLARQPCVPPEGGTDDDGPGTPTRDNG